MIDLYSPSVQALARAQHAHGLPMLVWLGDERPTDPEVRVVAANLAHMLGGVLFIDENAA